MFLILRRRFAGRFVRGDVRVCVLPVSLFPLLAGIGFVGAFASLFMRLGVSGPSAVTLVEVLCHELPFAGICYVEPHGLQVFPCEDVAFVKYVFLNQLLLAVFVHRALLEDNELILHSGLS